MEILHNPLFIFFLIVLYLVILLVLKGGRSWPYSIPKTQRRVGIILILIFCLFAVHDTDYFHYMDSLRYMSIGYESHLEPVYNSIADFLNYNYLLFRFVVWGGALAILILTIRRLDMPVELVLAIFALMAITRFSYARASLAMAVAFYGYSFLIRPSKHRVLSYVWGVIILSTAYFFHNSAVFLVPVILVSLFRLNGFTIGILVLIYPILVYLMNNYALQYILAGEEELELLNKAQLYITADATQSGIANVIRRVLMASPYYLLMISIIGDIMRKRSRDIEASEQKIMNVTFFIVYFASLFLFTSAFNTTIIYYRFLYYAMIPASMTLAIYKWYKINARIYSSILMIAIFACIYEMLYSLYISVVA